MDRWMDRVIKYGQMDGQGDSYIAHKMAYFQKNNVLHSKCTLAQISFDLFKNLFLFMISFF